MREPNSNFEDNSKTSKFDQVTPEVNSSFARSGAPQSFVKMAAEKVSGRSVGTARATGLKSMGQEEKKLR